MLETLERYFSHQGIHPLEPAESYLLLSVLAGEEMVALFALRAEKRQMKHPQVVMCYFLPAKAPTHTVSMVGTVVLVRIHV